MSKPSLGTVNCKDRRPKMKMKAGIPAADEGASEGSGSGLPIVQAAMAGERPQKWTPLWVKSDPVEGQLKVSETPWQGFLKEAESSRPAWGYVPPSEVESSSLGLSGVHVGGPSGLPKMEKRLPPSLAEGRRRTSKTLKAGAHRDQEDLVSNGTAHAEVQRRCFRGFCYQEAEGPRRTFHHLQELCRGWLKPERNTKDQMVELVAMEQFLAILPTEMQRWVRGHRTETCSQAVALAEEFLTMQEEAEKWESPVPCTSDGEATSAPEEGPMLMDAEDRQPYSHAKQESVGEALCLEDDEGLADEDETESQGVPFEKVEFVAEEVPADGPESPGKHSETELPKWKPKPGWELAESDVCQVTIPAIFPEELLKHACPVCGKAFTRKSSLNRHLIVHAGEKPYKCSHCGKGFNRKMYLLAHEVGHGEEASYQCSDCGKSFSLKWGVTDCQIDPSGVTVYKCSSCKKGSHREEEEEEESYQCSDCGKTFKLKWGVTTYQVDPSGTKVYKCSSCRKSSRRRAVTVKGESPNERGKEPDQAPRAVFKAEDLSSRQEELEEEEEEEAGKESREINYPSLISPTGDLCQVKSQTEYYRIKRRCPCPVCGKIFATQLLREETVLCSSAEEESSVTSHCTKPFLLPLVAYDELIVVQKLEEFRGCLPAERFPQHAARRGLRLLAT
ncbi:hypothetical protein JRQ81_012143 [Phrynocephalus forsythii]|uniref:Uncharacterized protein n=1 Tax=Phrynocephalus forsythii TaxID=171643 RepID=A0A9Q1AQ93_9SAUR|nr:hypothetical protein JRQ81_012143 [Phrynocephalus forsythii]